MVIANLDRYYSYKETMFAMYAARCGVTPEQFERIAFHEISGIRDNIFDMDIENYGLIPACYRV